MSTVIILETSKKICHKRLDSSIYLSQYFISHVIMTILQGAGHKLNVAACLCFSQLKSFPFDDIVECVHRRL